MFLCFLLLLGVFYHPPLYNFNCEWDITRSIREVWIKMWIFARTKELIFSFGFLKWSCCFLNSNLTLVLWQVNLFEAFWGSNFTEGVWKWILSWSYFWVWKQVFRLGFLASAISCWDSKQSVVFPNNVCVVLKEKRNGQLFCCHSTGFKIGNRTEAPTPAVLQKSTFCTGMCLQCKLGLKCLLWKPYPT